MKSLYSVRYSGHALSQMEERKITQNEVRYVLSHPTKLRNIFKKNVQRYHKEDFVRGHKVRVVFVEVPGWVEVITVMWVYETSEETKV